MGKGEYIVSLIKDIKDNIECDSDIQVLVSLLNYLLNIDMLNSFQYWKYIIENYDLKQLRYDIDFSPLYIAYLSKLIDKIDFENFFQKMKEIELEKRKIIYANIFNIYEKENYLDIYFNKLILKQDFDKEEKIIKLIIKESKEFPHETFDLTDFLKKIIIIHVKYEIIPQDLLARLTNIPNLVKERAILKALLINYIR